MWIFLFSENQDDSGSSTGPLRNVKRENTPRRAKENQTNKMSPADVQLTTGELVVTGCAIVIHSPARAKGQGLLALERMVVVYGQEGG